MNDKPSEHKKRNDCQKKVFCMLTLHVAEGAAESTVPLHHSWEEGGGSEKAHFFGSQGNPEGQHYKLPASVTPVKGKK